MGSINSKFYGTAGPFLEYKEIAWAVKRGDFIEIQPKNRGSKYSLWVFFESFDSNGNVWCFHVTVTDPNKKALIKYEPLEDILKNTNNGQPSLCRINNQEKVLRDRGLQALELFDVYLDKIFKMRDKYVDDDLRSKNCEDYCTLCKYGIGWKYMSLEDILKDTDEDQPSLCQINNQKFYGPAGPFLEYKEIASAVKRADLIEIKRENRVSNYRHWVFCESVDSNGNVWCYHVAIPDHIRKRFNTQALIKYEPLEDILKDKDNGRPSLSVELIIRIGL